MTGTIAKKKESGPRLQLAIGDYTGSLILFSPPIVLVLDPSVEFLLRSSCIHPVVCLTSGFLDS
jgi:hypothetical protein